MYTALGPDGFAMPFHPSPNLKLPHPLDGYTLIERLGRGGFGEVWKCEAPGGFLKAVKFVYGDLESMEDGRPAEQELKSLGRVKDIRHPYILTLERYDIIEGQLMVMMELAECNLWDRFRECRVGGKIGIPRPALLRYMCEAAEALDLMNSKYRLQHLDIKPQNLFVVFDHVKVADFGLAKVFEGAKATVTGGVTPVYAAPETFEGHVSRFSDQYSLAIVFMELLTGCRPFNGQNTKQLLLQHLREQPDLSALEEYDRSIILRALSKEPDSRWPSCRELVQQLVEAPNSVTRLDFGALPIPVGPEQTPRPAGLPGSPPLSPLAGAPLTQQATAIRDTVGLTRRTEGPATRAAPTLRGPILRPQSDSGSFGLPSLVTPKMSQLRPDPTVSQRIGQTADKISIVETGRMGALGIAPPERTGTGDLLPAIIVGLGRTGLDVLLRFRHLLKDRFGSLEATPHLRFLYIDTDADDASLASQDACGLAPHEIALARLQRPAHYLQREGLPPVEQWLPPGLLYQLPKTSGPAAGMRSFGRLALCDAYRQVAQRIRQEIEPLMNEGTLREAEKTTGLQLRTNRPRVYIAASLDGGTGSGMFLDLAYVMKHELKNVGYRKPEVHGFLFVPPAAKGISRRAQANTVAALTELHHFNKNPYQVRFDMSEAAVTDSSPPYDRTALMQWPGSQKDPLDGQRRVGAAARAMYLELMTPMGKRIDEVRAAAPEDRMAGPTVQPFNIFRLTWPRFELLTTITRAFCQQTLRQWATKESTHLKEPIQFWLVDQWTQYRLEASNVMAQLDEVVVEAMRGPADHSFRLIVSALAVPGAGKVDGASAVAALDQLIKFVGKPEIESSLSTPMLKGILDAKAAEILAEAETHLSTVAVSFLEMPQYRLAGAEEAVQQMMNRLTEIIDDLEDKVKKFSQDATNAYAKLFPVIGSLAGNGFTMAVRRTSITNELMELLEKYPQARYQVLLHGAAVNIYRKLRDAMPEIKRDVNHCREVLLGFVEKFGKDQKRYTSENEPGAYALPMGCETIEAAAEQLIANLPPEDILEFDHKVQKQIQKKFRGLAGLSLKPEKAAQFPVLLSDAVREFLELRLEKADSAEALTRYRGFGNECLNVLEKAYDSAKVDIVQGQHQALEATILATPNSESGEKLRQLIHEANPDIEFIPATMPEDIIVYREHPRTPLSDVPQFGETARQAYSSQMAGDQQPHSRCDIAWTVPLKTVP